MSEAAFDVVIVGGGMVGASLAVALAPLKLRVALIEAVPHDADNQPSFDERTTALSNGSRRVLDTLGIWGGIASHASPIKKIHVSDRGRFGFARIDAQEQNLAALGYVLPNRVLGSALWTRIAGEPNVRVFCPAQVGDLAIGVDRVTLEAVARDGASTALSTGLIVAADGAQSAVRKAFGVDADVTDYHQTAVITTVMPQQFHQYTAYERFTPDGPLALLPMNDGRCTLVLTLDPERATAALTWPDDVFLAEVQARFGFRLGRFLKVGRRTAYPLSLTQSRQTTAGRCVIIGNAAQGLHPVAGMGFNLGLRDAACLAELLAEKCIEVGPDCGAAALLARYDEWRASDRRGIIGFTDSLVRLFANPLGVVRHVRNIGLLAFDLLPPAKAALSRLSTGTARASKLARGVPLT
jgi:2-octaprenyl-6-methoxyphenol hydroxylase